MNATYALLGAAVALALASCSGASAAPSGPISLDASGYAAIDGAIRAVSMDLALSARDDGTLSSVRGTIMVGDDVLSRLDIDGSFLREARFLRVSGTAEGQGDAVMLKMLGRLAEERGRDSAYLFTGTLERNGAVGKAVLAASLSQLAEAATGMTATAASVTILPSARVPGAPPGSLDVSTVQATPGQVLTISNTSATKHRLVSGTINDWFYERDGDPRTCAPDGTPDVEVERENRNHTSADVVTSDRCDFTRDGRVDVEIEPGESASIQVQDTGIYRMLDLDSPWIQLTAVSVALPPR